MKKLLVITLALAVPQAFAAFRTPGKTAEQVEQQEREAEEGSWLNLTGPAFQKLLGTVEEQFPQWKTTINKIASGDYAGKLTELVGDLKSLVKSSLQNLTPALQKPEVIRSLDTVTVQDIRGLINALNGYAKNAPTGILRNSALNEIYNKIKDTYKNLVKIDNDIFTAQQGGVYSTVVQAPSHKLADDFLKGLIYNHIIEGKTIEEILPLITSSLELEKSPFETVQPAKGSKTAAGQFQEQ